MAVYFSHSFFNRELEMKYEIKGCTSHALSGFLATNYIKVKKA